MLRDRPLHSDVAYWQRRAEAASRLSQPISDAEVERAALNICRHLPGRLDADEICNPACGGCKRDARAALEAGR
jgi:bacterioferritin-associated ferredoxin